MSGANCNNSLSSSSSESSQLSSSSSGSSALSSSSRISLGRSSPATSPSLPTPPQPYSRKSSISSSSASSDLTAAIGETAEREGVKMLDQLLGIKAKLACDLCGKKVLHLKSHMKKMHGEGRPGCAVECGQCDRTILLSDMTDHVLNYHIRLERSPSPNSGEESQFSVKDWVMKEDDEPNLSQDVDKHAQEVCQVKSSQEVQMPESIYINNIRVHDDDILEDSDAEKDADVFIRNSSLTKSNSESSRKSPPPSSGVVPTIKGDQSHNIDSQESKVVFKSFLCDDSDDTDDSDISIVEIVPPVSNMPDYNQNRQLKPLPQPREGKVQFLVKSKEKNPVGGKVKSMRLVMRSVKTVGQVKRKYCIKQVLDRDRLGELQMVMEGRRLGEQELVGQLDNKVVMAKGLSFTAGKIL